MTESSAAQSSYLSREDALRDVERDLRRGSPRTAMTLLLALTGAAGFLFSYDMLHLGVDRMVVRYPAAVLAAYCVFLLLLRAWAETRKPRRRHRSWLDWVHVDAPSGGGPGDARPMPSGAASHSHAPARVSARGSGGSGDWFSLDLDEGLFLVVAAVGLAAVLISAVWVLWMAPSLLAEVALDAVLVTGLYRRVRPTEQRWWAQSAVRYTCGPLLLAMGMLALCGSAMQALAPDARSIGEVWETVHRPFAASPASR